jgi:succinate-acetate transporter protein
MSANNYTGEKAVNNLHTNDLSRQVTLQLSSEQYERLFFQPSQAKGDLSKRLGNPTLLGVIGFMVPFTSIVLSFLQFEGSSTQSVTAISASFYFFGGIAMNIAGIAEFILGNTFPFVAFVVYGTHWLVLAYTSDPSHGIIASYAVDPLPGTLSQEFNAGQGNYNLVMAIVSFVFLCGSIRTNVPFVILFIGLVLLFSFVSAAYYQLGYQGLQGLAHATHYFRIAGGFGFVSMTSGWYLTLLQVFAATGIPVPLPIFDLSHLVFPNGTREQKVEHEN